MEHYFDPKKTLKYKKYHRTPNKKENGCKIGHLWKAMIETETLRRVRA